MKRRGPPFALALGIAVLCGLAEAQQIAAEPNRRAEIAAERAAVDRRHAEQEQACRRRFVVTSCLNEARDQRRAAMVPLRREELRIDTDERKHRAAARLGEIETKQRIDAARDAASAPPAERDSPGAREPSRPAGRIGGGSPKPTISAEERARRESESEAKFERQRQEAASHRAAVEARNAERAAKGKVVKPLPVAPGASAL